MTVQNTIEKFLDNFDGKQVDSSIDFKRSIGYIKDIAAKIPVNGEYDPSIIGPRIGEYVSAILICDQLLASLGLVEAYQETEVDKEQALASLDRAVKKGYSTAGERKLYAQMDNEYIEAKNRLSEIQAMSMYIESYRSGFDKAQLHCKKIIDRSYVEQRFAGDHERFATEEVNWINDKDLK